MDGEELDRAVNACQDLIAQRFPGGGERGAAAMLLADGTILTGTAPDAVNPAVEVCHEIEPSAGAFRPNQKIMASVCLHRDETGRVLVLRPCGVCRERLAVHGPDVLVGVTAPEDPAQVVWKRLRDVLPDYWITVFSQEVSGRRR